MEGHDGLCRCDPTSELYHIKFNCKICDIGYCLKCQASCGFGEELNMHFYCVPEINRCRGENCNKYLCGECLEEEKRICKSCGEEFDDEYHQTSDEFYGY